MDLDHALLHLKKDNKLNSIIEIAIPPQFQVSENVYYDLLDSVVYQQLSIKVARVIFNRFCALFPDSYPHPELLVFMQPEQLRQVGLSGQKHPILQNIASFALENRLEAIPFGCQLVPVAVERNENLNIFSSNAF